MKLKIRFVLIAVFYSTILYSQNNVKPIISVGYFSNSLNHGSLKTNNLEFGIGIQIYQKIWTSCLFDIHINQSHVDKSVPIFKFSTFGVGGGYRFLSDEYIFSPELSSNFGIGLKNKLSGEFINDTYNITNLSSENVIGRFESVVYHGKIGLNLSVKANEFRLNFGPVFCYYNFRIQHKFKDEFYEKGLKGLGLEIKMIYTFFSNGEKK